MKDYSKIGNRQGSPAYRTPTAFRLLAFSKVNKIKTLSRQYKHAKQICQTNRLKTGPKD
jgi:hypothetical protein